MQTIDLKHALNLGEQTLHQAQVAIGNANNRCDRFGIGEVVALQGQAQLAPFVFQQEYHLFFTQRLKWVCKANTGVELRETAFIEAAKMNQAVTMQLLLDWGADMFAEGPGSMDALVWSSVLGQTKAVAFLLEHGMNVADNRGTRALRLAMHKGHSRIISLLRQAGALDSE